MLNLAKFIRNVASGDPNRRAYALKLLGDWLMGDYRATWFQIDWHRDPDFNRFLDRFDERFGFNTHRKWTLWQLMRLVAEVPGDTAECGVFTGSSSWLICAANRHSRFDRKHHLFDSFEGLSEPGAHDGAHWTEGDMRCHEDVVADNLEPFTDQLVFHKGWIPERFGSVEERRFAFVHVDVDLYEPTLDSVAFFYDRLEPGGILLCDDYGFWTCPGATRAIDGFLADRPEEMLSLAAGGGFLIKGVPTAGQASMI